VGKPALGFLSSEKSQNQTEIFAA